MTSPYRYDAHDIYRWVRQTSLVGGKANQRWTSNDSQEKWLQGIDRIYRAPCALKCQVIVWLFFCKLCQTNTSYAEQVSLNDY